MAFILEPVGQNNSRLATEDDNAVGWEDWGRAALSGAAEGVVGSAAGAAEYLTGGAIGGDTRRAASEYAEDVRGGMSPRARTALQASFIPGEGESGVLEEGIGRSLALKAMGMLPQLASAVIPGGIAARVATVLGASRAGATVAAIGAARASEATLAAGDVASTIYQTVEGYSDQELKDLSPAYAAYLNMGYAPKEARDRYMRDVDNYAPLVAAGVTSLMGGVESQLATKFVKGAIPTQSILKGARRGAIAEGTQEFAQEGTGSLATNAALAANNLDDFSWREVLSAAVEGGVMGGALGGAAGAASNARMPTRVPSPVPGVEPNTPSVPARTGEAMAPVPAEASSPGGAPNSPPIMADTPPNPQNAPTIVGARNQRKAKRVIPAQVTPVAENTPVAADQAVSLAASTPSPISSIAPPIIDTPQVSQNSPVVGVSTIPVPIQPPAPQAAPAASQTVLEGAPTLAPIAPATPSVVTSPEVTPEVTTPTPPPAAKGPRILEDQSIPESVRAKIREAQVKQAEQVKSDLKADARREEGPKPKNATKAERIKRTQENTLADEVVTEFTPSEVERNYVGNTGRASAARGAILARAKNMVARAEEKGFKVPNVIAESLDPEMARNDNTLILSEARALTKVKKPTEEDFSRFYLREAMIRSGKAQGARAERRAEGEAKKRVGQKNVETVGVIDAATTQDSEASGIPAVNKEDVTTAVVRSSKGAVRDTRSEEQPGSEVRKPKLSEEDKARILGFANKTTKPIQGVTKGVASSPTVTTPSVTSKVTEGVVTKPTLTPTIKAKINAAAKQVERNPTDAQVEAGNYAKGHFSYNGLNIAIETPKGAMRRSKERDEDGKPTWEVKLPAHYGYIKGTEGADNDPVDIYMGPTPNSDTVFIIDQKDADSGRFDEHKVMLGFANARAAIETYMDGFSDGRGSERFSDVTVKTIPEFKEWLNARKATKQEAGATVDAAVLADISSDAPIGEANYINDAPILDVGYSDTGYTSTNLDGTTIIRGTRGNGRAIETSNVRELFNDILTPDKVKGRGITPLFPVLRQKLLAAVPDVPIHTMSQADIQTMRGDPRQALGFYNMLNDYIVIDERVFNNPEQAVHVLLHEITHAATIDKIRKDPNVKAWVRTLMDEVVAFDPVIAKARGTQYGMTSEVEFIAEAMSNVELQNVLKQIPLNEDLSSQLNIKDWRKLTTWDGFVEWVRQALGVPKAGVSMLEGVVSLTERIMYDRDREGGNLYADRQADMRRNRARAEALMARRTTPTSTPTNSATQDVDAPMLGGYLQGNREGNTNTQNQVTSPRALGLRTLDQIVQLGNRFFEGFNPLRPIVDIVEQIRTSASKYLRASEPLLRDMHALEKRFSKEIIEVNGKPSTQWQEFTSLVHDETMAGVFADQELTKQKHLGQNRMSSEWSKAQHEGLAARYTRLPKELKDMRARAMEFYTAQQNDMSYKIINNKLLKVLDIQDDALASRVHNNTLTQDDKNRLGDMYTFVVQATELSKIDGPYFPLMRHGEYVVQARYRVTPPTGTGVNKISDNTYDFDDKKEAIAWAKKQTTRPNIQSVYVDPTTGSEFFEELQDNGTLEETKVTSQDVAGVKRIRVTVQDRHVEFFRTAKEAQDAAGYLEGNASFAEVRGVEQRKFERADRVQDMASSQMEGLLGALSKREGYKRMSAGQQFEMRRLLTEASVRFMGSTRIQSKRLPRTYVEGASKDLTLNTQIYSQSTSNYLARLDHAPALEAAIANAVNSSKSDNYAKNTSLGRSALIKEVQTRVEGASAFESPGAFNGWGQRVLSLSMLSHLASPAYSMVNAMGPAMVTLPSIASRFGTGRAAGMMIKAYDDIGGFSTVKAGARNTVANVRVPGTTGSYVNDIRARLKEPREKQLIDYLSERGTIDPDAGLEIGRVIQNADGLAGRVDVGLYYLEGISRQMPQAVEAINRSVSAVAAYRLEYARTGDHEASMVYAQEVTNMTQGLYSHTNAPPVFNHPIARLALQFKKYGQLIYGMIGHNIGQAFNGATPEARREAIKTLAFMAVTHGAMAGALGLPTEPIKWLVIGANQAGLTDFTWSDVENYERSMLSNLLGNNLGEIAARGLPRAVGLDLSSRVGIADVFTFGEPRSDKPQDLSAFIADTIIGAPGGMALDTIEGANKLFTGDISGAAQKLIPLKIIKDSIAGYKLATEGKRSAARYQSQDPQGAVSGLVKAAGLTTGATAENRERRSYFYGAQARNTADRSDLMRQYNEASSSERGQLWGKIATWNKNRPKDQRLTRAELESYKKRRQNETKNNKVVNGFKLGRRDQSLYKDTEETYNVR